MFNLQLGLRSESLVNECLCVALRKSCKRSQHAVVTNVGSFPPRQMAIED